HAARREPDAAAVAERLDERAVEFAQEAQADAWLGGEVGEFRDADVLLASVVDLDERQRDEAEGGSPVDDALRVAWVLGQGRVEELAGVGQDEVAGGALE